jgi:hypothetical protein
MVQSQHGLGDGSKCPNRMAAKIFISENEQHYINDSPNEGIIHSSTSIPTHFPGTVKLPVERMFKQWGDALEVKEINVQLESLKLPNPTSVNKIRRWLRIGFPWESRGDKVERKPGGSKQADRTRFRSWASQVLEIMPQPSFRTMV